MSAPNVRVLYIDDEENNLQAFKASFRRQYEIYTAISAAEGLKVLQNISIQVILADQKMPGTTGVEFFKSIIDTYPDPIRILLTGYTDIEALADAINHGDIYRYITKPWNDLELHNSIKNAYDAYKAKIDLRNKVAELEKTNDELNRFIYSISHELRAPLVSAMGIVNLVKMEGLYNNSGEYWSLIETCSNKLDYYIQKTLQYYKNNKTISENTSIDFHKLIPELIELHTYADHQTTFSIDINQKEEFYGDAFRVEVILGNLISNAIKYQKETEINKRVNIHVDVRREQVEISINDNGMGILNEHLEKIFTQFFKSKVNQGSGLGLFIVKEALNKINGKITVSSNQTEGTTFKITIPNVK
ncbi:MAG: hybrid sensor histidine kinase/response regulator [Candidatus Pedobacter colombiensis]|uniref:histidine kinase n=1 Tax=Candidatus Pedobacter colombiensis TaxID=3121371 RepID=A0AAJ6B8D0_9SPHI|nr:hybrid sensor histidine kinase/response regulator [Pedobacter sp.]WEK20749.1 MAG: hybrid sensor histidine kinase/response regulator [Pedobacter sp.]